MRNWNWRNERVARRHRNDELPLGTNATSRVVRRFVKNGTPGRQGEPTRGRTLVRIAPRHSLSRIERADLPSGIETVDFG